MHRLKVTGCVNFLLRPCPSTIVGVDNQPFESYDPSELCVHEVKVREMGFPICLSGHLFLTT